MVWHISCKTEVSQFIITTYFENIRLYNKIKGTWVFLKSGKQRILQAVWKGEGATAAGKKQSCPNLGQWSVPNLSSSVDQGEGMDGFGCARVLLVQMLARHMRSPVPNGPQPRDWGPQCLLQF